MTILQIIDEIVKILKEFFVEAAENCLKQAANNCKKYWYNPKKLINCAVRILLKDE